MVGENFEFRQTLIFHFQVSQYPFHKGTLLSKETWQQHNPEQSQSQYFGSDSIQLCQLKDHKAKERCATKELHVDSKIFSF